MTSGSWLQTHSSLLPYTSCLTDLLYVNLVSMKSHTSSLHLGSWVWTDLGHFVTQMATWFLQLQDSQRCQRYGFTSASNCQPSKQLPQTLGIKKHCRCGCKKSLWAEYGMPFLLQPDSELRHKHHGFTLITVHLKYFRNLNFKALF